MDAVSASAYSETHAINPRVITNNDCELTLGSLTPNGSEEPGPQRNFLDIAMKEEDGGAQEVLRLFSEMFSWPSPAPIKHRFREEVTLKSQATELKN